MTGVLVASAILLTCGGSVGPEALCNRLSEIQSIPMKGPGSDELYRGLLEMGDAAVPCLIDRIADTTPMKDPRMTPSYSGFVVGDLAFFILIRITGVDGYEMLPEDVRAQYKEKGYFAYFDYVAIPSHRLDLQRRWRTWWSKHQTRTD